MSSTLDQLRDYSDIVADTGDLSSIARLKPIDATTNPSLILQAAENPAQRNLVLDVVHRQGDKPATAIARELAVRFATEISQLITGRVSVEVDARLSYDTQATYNEALALVERLQESGLARDRFLIKIAATWEGIAAAKLLEKSGINCNLTLVFCETQAIACANAGVFLISPFVGRILDWYKAKYPDNHYSHHNDPGVASVKKIFNLYKSTGSRTIVMGASFRSAEQVIALAGCDKLTVSPALLDELAQRTHGIEADLTTPLETPTAELAILSEQGFHDDLERNSMARQQLAGGISAFVNDQARLELLIAQLNDKAEAV